MKRRGQQPQEFPSAFRDNLGRLAFGTGSCFSEGVNASSMGRFFTGVGEIIGGIAEEEGGVATFFSAAAMADSCCFFAARVFFEK